VLPRPGPPVVLPPHAHGRRRPDRTPGAPLVGGLIAEQNSGGPAKRGQAPLDLARTPCVPTVPLSRSVSRNCPAARKFAFLERKTSAENWSPKPEVGGSSSSGQRGPANGPSFLAPFRQPDSAWNRAKQILNGQAESVDPRRGSQPGHDASQRLSLRPASDEAGTNSGTNLRASGGWSRQPKPHYSGESTLDPLHRSASQAEGRGFETRRPLRKLLAHADFHPTDPADVKAKVASLPVSRIRLSIAVSWG
jgi:hypothetical protein